MDSEPLSLYIHVPFCAKKCAYCDFVSFKRNEEVQKAYFNALHSEIRLFAKTQKHSNTPLKVDTVYFGGGTPSLVDEEHIAETLTLLRAEFDISEECEISLEANPDSISEEKLFLYRKSGVNRLSVGVQSFDDIVLKAIGRLHDAKVASDAFEAVKNAGFRNFNLDIMYALPKQSMKSLTDSLKIAASSGATHISAYSLILNEGTMLFKRYMRGEFSPDEETESAMYDAVNALLPSTGFGRYEVSNFAKAGFSCRHNYNLWNFRPYVGFGCAAHSFYCNERFENTSKLNDYIAFYEKAASYGEGREKVRFYYSLPEEREEEYLMLALRKTAGFATADFSERFGVSFASSYEKSAEKLVKNGLAEFYLKENREYFRLSEKGMKLGNYTIGELER